MTSLPGTIPFSLEPSLSLRSAQWADVESVAQLILDVCTVDGDPTAATTPEEIRSQWQAPGFNFEKNICATTTADAVG